MTHFKKCERKDVVPYTTVRREANKLKKKKSVTPEQMLSGLFVSKRHYHTLSSVYTRCSVIPYQAFRSSLNVSDPQSGALTGTIRDASLEK